jgi:phosphopantetheinyl transferase
VADDAERAARFMRLWTLKEAYVKALGKAVQDEPMKSMLVAPGTKRLKWITIQCFQALLSIRSCAATGGHRHRRAPAVRI